MHTIEAMEVAIRFKANHERTRTSMHKCLRFLQLKDRGYKRKALKYGKLALNTMDPVDPLYPDLREEKG